MSKTLDQIFILNPLASNAATDLMYFVQSPYTPGTDAGMTFANFALQFGAPYTPSALTKTDDTNVTLTLGGTPATSLLHAVSLTLGWTGLLSGTRGGTGVNNGASTITIGGSITFSGAFTFTGTLTGNTSVTFPTSGTLATTSQLLVSPLTTKGDIWVWSTTNDRLPVATGDGKILQVSSGASTGLAYSTATYPTLATSTGSFIYADGTNYISSTSLWPNTVGTSGKVVISNGTSNVYSTPTFPNASSASGIFMISDGTNWVASTSTIPTSAGSTANKFLISDGTNYVLSASTITLGGNFTTSGAFTTTLTVTGNTNVTLPTSGTLSTTTGTVTSVATSGLATGGTITSTGTITVTAAVKSDQTTGTSTSVAVVPGVQQYHDSAAKAWAYTTSPGSSPPTLSASYNISSIVRNSTGRYTYNFTTSFASANYVAHAMEESNAGWVWNGTKATGSCVIATNNSAVSPAAADVIHNATWLGTQ